MLNGLDADRNLLNIDRAGGFARRGTDTSCEFQKVVRQVQHVKCQLPLPTVDEIIEIGNDVVQRASIIAKQCTAIHARRRLASLTACRLDRL